MYKYLLAFILGVVINGTLALSPKPVSISITPSYGFEPLRVKSIITIEPNEANRQGCIVYSGTEYATQSCKDLNGANEPKLSQASVVLPAGLYDISVTIYRNDGKVIQSNIVNVKVLSKSGAGSGVGNLNVRGIY